MNESLSVDVLQYIIYGPGSGYIAYKLMEVFSEGFDNMAEFLANSVPFFGPRGMKRMISFGLSTYIAALAYFASMILGYESPPLSLREAADVTIILTGLSGVTSQTIHAHTQLDKDKDATTS